MPILRTLNFQWATITQIVPRHFFSLFIFFYHKIQNTIRQGSCAKANESGEEAPQKTMRLNRHWALLEQK